MVITWKRVQLCLYPWKLSSGKDTLSGFYSKEHKRIKVQVVGDGRVKWIEHILRRENIMYKVDESSVLDPQEWESSTDRDKGRSQSLS